MRGLSASQANPDSYAVGCVLDGIPTNCNRVMQALNRLPIRHLGIHGNVTTPWLMRLIGSITRVETRREVDSPRRVPPSTTYKDDQGNEYPAHGLQPRNVIEVVVQHVVAPGMQLGFEPVEPQKSQDDNFTPEQLERLKDCLSEMFKVYYKDHHYDRNGEAYFAGHSDTRAPWSIFKVGSFTVKTDQQSYSSTDLKRKLGPLAGSFFGRGLVVGFTDKRSPFVNAIANDAGAILKGKEFLGLWVYELGNALSVITGFNPDVPADAQERYGVAGEPGAAFSDCVFGGAVTSTGSVVRPGG